jgi:uracil-DNA glycosylase
MKEFIELSMLEKSWQAAVGGEFAKPYMQTLKTFLREEKDRKKVIYPKSANVFNAFHLTPFPQVKVVLLGQDPYHGKDQAHGLCFSVQPGIPLPPSLVNIYKELKSDLGIAIASTGCLVHWAEQGVLLLNSVLTVEEGRPASHQGKGWEQFTDRVIGILNEQKSNVVFLLWGAYAQKKGQFIDNNKHCVLKAAHPSPFSAYQGFFGCKHFSLTNTYLENHGLPPIDWRVVT